MEIESPPLPELVSFLETLPVPHILCNAEYRILAANAAYRARFGEARSCVGRTCYEVSHRYQVPCDQAGETCPLRRSLASGQRERVLHLHHTPRGEDYVNLELSPLRDVHGDIAYFVEKMEPLETARERADNPVLIGRAPAFQHMLEMVSRVAPSDATVLLQGESGTGKELVAKAIHQGSRRSDAAFVAVDCSGLPETLFESELFGYERGAFTGATVRKPGLVESASGGTLFLDEVGDIPLGVQVKLLRLLETGSYRRVGSTEPRQADIRLISATHRPLRRMVEQAQFRQDLYFRLNTFPIDLPPLRERREDVPPLVEALLARVAARRRLKVAPAAMRRLVDYDYPGNVRELRNLLERASLMCDGDVIEERNLADELLQPAGHAPAPVAARDAGGTWNDIERAAFRQLVASHQGSRRALARKLGLSERSLYRKLKALGIKAEGER
ncbi:MAG: sigma-54-dependent Fis family transcriptional regulator [Betaproteobacteria bacterium]|nr:sigma-54-dependent Fis family transcriptional regulator [Betaproteobacteria bacterium]